MKKALLLIALVVGTAAISREPNTWRGSVELVDPAALQRLLHQDSLQVEHAFLRGNDLHLRISYNGGTQPHEFRLLARREPAIIIWRDRHPGPPPPPRQRHTLYLSHNANGERARTPMEAELVFDLRPLRYQPGPIPLRLSSPQSRDGEGLDLIFK